MGKGQPFSPKVQMLKKIFFASIFKFSGSKHWLVLAQRK
jgi:hypothetical protein